VLGRRSLWLVALVGSVGCAVPPLDGDGKACPCAPGWLCVADVCVRDGIRLLDGGRPVDVGPGNIDGGGFDAGPIPPGIDGGPDAGPRLPDAGPDAGPPLECGAITDAIFCSGFEGGGEWSTRGGAASFDDGIVPVEGTTALLSPGDGDYVSASIAIPDDVWMRAWVYVPSAAATTPGDAQIFGVGSSGDLTQTGFGLAVSGLDLLLRVGNNGLGHRAPLGAADAWHCVEIEAHQSERSFTVYYDGSRTFTGVTFSGAVDEVSAGVRELSSGEAIVGDVRVDDLVVARSRIGC